MGVAPVTFSNDRERFLVACTREVFLGGGVKFSSDSVVLCDIV